MAMGMKQLAMENSEGEGGREEVRLFGSLDGLHVGYLCLSQLIRRLSQTSPPETKRLESTRVNDGLEYTLAA